MRQLPLKSAAFSRIATLQADQMVRGDGDGDGVGDGDGDGDGHGHGHGHGHGDFIRWRSEDLGFCKFQLCSELGSLCN